MDETYTYLMYQGTCGVTIILKGFVDQYPKVIVVQAGGENAILIWKTSQNSCENHNQMNSTNCEKWLREKLIPNLQPNLADNAQYHIISYK